MRSYASYNQLKILVSIYTKEPLRLYTKVSFTWVQNVDIIHDYTRVLLLAVTFHSCWSKSSSPFPLQSNTCYPSCWNEIMFSRSIKFFIALDTYNILYHWSYSVYNATGKPKTISVSHYLCAGNTVPIRPYNYYDQGIT